MYGRQHFDEGKKEWQIRKRVSIDREKIPVRVSVKRTAFTWTVTDNVQELLTWD